MPALPPTVYLETSLTFLPLYYNQLTILPIDGFHSPSILLLTSSECLYVLELIVGFESNLKNNAKHKKENYENTVKSLSSDFKCITFPNLSINSPGVFSDD